MINGQTGMGLDGLGMVVSCWVFIDREWCFDFIKVLAVLSGWEWWISSL